MLLNKEIEVAPAEYQAWLKHPTTAAIMEALSYERSCWVQRLVMGETLEAPIGKEMLATARTVGTIEGLTILLEDLEFVLQSQWEEAKQIKEAQREEEEDGE